VNNPNNYIGINATIVGYVAADPRPPAYDRDDERGIREIPIPINHGYKNRDGDWVETSTTWINYVAAGDAADSLESKVRKGDKIRLDDTRLETRQYKDKEGNARIGVEARFGNLTVLEEGDGRGSGGDKPF